MWLVMCLLFGFDVNATFELVRAGPAASALLLVGRGRPGAGNAADRAIARLVQRVVRNLVDLDVGPDARLGDWSLRMPAIQPSYGSSASNRGSTLRMWQQRSGSLSQRFGPSRLCCSATVITCGLWSVSPYRSTSRSRPPSRRGWWEGGRGGGAGGRGTRPPLRAEQHLLQRVSA